MQVRREGCWSLRLENMRFSRLLQLLAVEERSSWLWNSSDYTRSRKDRSSNIRDHGLFGGALWWNVTSTKNLTHLMSLVWVRECVIMSPFGSTSFASFWTIHVCFYVFFVSDRELFTFYWVCRSFCSVQLLLFWIILILWSICFL